MNNLMVCKRLKKRKAAEKRFKFFCKTAVSIAMITLVLMLCSIVYKSLDSFVDTNLHLSIDPLGKTSVSEFHHVTPLLHEILSSQHPHLQDNEREEIIELITPQGFKRLFLSLKNTTGKNKFSIALPLSIQVKRHLDHQESTLSLIQKQWIESAYSQGMISNDLSFALFYNTDSRDVESAGILGGVIGTLFLIMMTLLFAFPVGIGTAIYLEEFAKKNRLTTLIEINISNLAAVPSIVFGILGVAIFINILHLPRSSAVVGGLTLALMTLPTIILAAKTALKTVPKSIREAARGLGASSVQVSFHHVLPLAMPGILTGTIIATARALGETAPLLMIGMMAFIVDLPSSPLDPTSALPVQIFNWARNPEPGFMSKAAAGIVVILLLMILVNLVAIVLRRKYEQRW